MVFKDYCGFKYGYDKKEGYFISPRLKMEKPTSFYKYYPLNENSVSALTNLYVYASHPKQFNDPFDCNANLIKFGTWEDVMHLWEALFDSFKEKHPYLETACEESNRAYWAVLYKKLGLVSMTSQVDNYQMWSLYAQNDGFCVEFDTDKLPFLHYGPFPINYTENITVPLHISDVGGYLAMLIQTNVKNDWWKYENEWRLYVPNPEGFDFVCYGTDYEMKQFNRGDEHDRKFRYPIEVLRSVTLGPNFFENIAVGYVAPDEIEVVCNIHKDKLKHQVLSFLAKVTEKVDLIVKVAVLETFNMFSFNSIRILQYADDKFRITMSNK